MADVADGVTTNYEDPYCCKVEYSKVAPQIVVLLLAAPAFAGTL
jgi:hypothetical protein